MNDKLKPALVIGALLCVACAFMQPVVAVVAFLFLAIRYLTQWKNRGEFPPGQVFATTLLGGTVAQGTSWLLGAVMFRRTLDAMSDGEGSDKLLHDVFGSDWLVALLGVAAAIAFSVVIVLSIGAALLAYGLPSLQRPKAA